MFCPGIVENPHKTTPPNGHSWASEIYYEDYMNSIPKWQSDSDQSSNDWGIVVLRDNLGEKTGWAKLRYYINSTDMIDINFELCGYPKYVKRNGNHEQFRQWTHTGPIKFAQPRWLSYWIDADGGQSGCPIMTLDTHAIAGIHSQSTEGWNYGCNISSDIITMANLFIRQNE